MLHPILPLSTAIAVALGAAVVPLDSAGANANYRKGYILAKPVPGLPADRLEKEIQKAGGKVARKLNSLEVRVIAVPEGREAQLANALSHNPHILYAAPDLLIEPVATVNDPNFSSQWHLPVMGAPLAWDMATGTGVTVAVCDSGVNASHVDLSGQVLSGWNTASNSADTSDVHGHGTWVAGVIAEKANNLTGGASVAPNARILPMRVTDRTDGWAYTSDIAEAITWAADHGARVANVSFGVSGDPTVGSAASYMMSKGGIVVASAGNSGADPGYGNSPYIFTAAATDSGDERASWSNYGEYVDVAAPGVGIFTTDRGGDYASVSGTSFSSPNTAAVAALVMSANPSLTPTDVTSIITNTAKDLGDAGWDPYYGHGRVNAAAAVAMAASAQTSDHTAPSVAVATPSQGATVKDVVTVDVQATDDFGVMSVDFLVNGAVVSSETQEDPKTAYVFRFGWDTTTGEVPDGLYRLTARAKDAAGNVGSAREVSVTVANNDDTTPPTFTSRTPASDAEVSGVITMSASATDNVAVANVTVSGGGVSCSGTTSASCNLNTRKIPGGTTIQVNFTATDTAGNTATEQSSVVVCCAATDTTTTDTTTALPRGRAKK